MNQEFEELLSTIPQDQNLLRGVEEATKQGAVLPIAGRNSSVAEGESSTCTDIIEEFSLKVKNTNKNTNESSAYRAMFLILN